MHMVFSNYNCSTIHHDFTKRKYVTKLGYSFKGNVYVANLIQDNLGI